MANHSAYAGFWILRLDASTYHTIAAAGKRSESFSSGISSTHWTVNFRVCNTKIPEQGQEEAKAERQVQEAKTTFL